MMRSKRIFYCFTLLILSQIIKVAAQDTLLLTTGEELVVDNIELESSPDDEKENSYIGFSLGMENVDRRRIHINQVQSIHLHQSGMLGNRTLGTEDLSLWAEKTRDFFDAHYITVWPDSLERTVFKGILYEVKDSSLFAFRDVEIAELTLDPRNMKLTEFDARDIYRLDVFKQEKSNGTGVTLGILGGTITGFLVSRNGSASSSSGSGGNIVETFAQGMALGLSEASAKATSVFLGAILGAIIGGGLSTPEKVTFKVRFDVSKFVVISYDLNKYSLKKKN